MTTGDVKKAVLAYSGGLDTSIILKWLQTTYGCEVVTFTADLGQGDELEPARQKALLLGIKPNNIFIEDLREEFVRDYVYPMFRANALHTSSEGKVLEDPAREVPDHVYSRTVDPERAPDEPAHVGIDFERGDAVAVDGAKLSPAKLLARLNELGRAHGVGRLDLVENRFVGMKSRGLYETPGGTIMLSGHRAIESITLDRGAAHLKDELMPKYAELVYNGFWFAPEREMLQAAIDHSQQYVTGRVRLKLYKGNAIVVGRESKYSLYDQDLVTFEEGAVAYDHRDAAGFIKLNALRLRTLGQRRKKLGL